MRSVKGEITVFLSLSFTLLLSFIFGILESAVIQGSKNLSRIDTDRAIYSVFGEYHQELMEQYHVLGIDLGYRTGNYEEENLIQRLHYYNSGSTDHQIKGIQYLTDQSGQAFREQVLAYMEQRYGMDLVKKFTGTTEKWEQTETEESDMEKKTDEMTDAMERVNDSLDASGSQTEGEDVEEGPSLPDEENPFRIMKKISQEVEKADQEQREKDYLILPDQVDGRKLSWKPVKEMRAFGILLLGGVMIVFQFTAEKQKQKEQRKKEIRQMQFDYPQLINKFSLYIGAGMTVRRAWIQIVKEYDKEKHYLGERTVYEEMRYTMNELKNGRPESECYEAFGRRCESPVYRKFGMLLSQNLRKGTKGLKNLLQREAQEAFEERKNMAKKLGEEAGTKLMIPLFLMLAVVFVIVTVPAFLTIQI